MYFSWKLSPIFTDYHTTEREGEREKDISPSFHKTFRYYRNLNFQNPTHPPRASEITGESLFHFRFSQFGGKRIAITWVWNFIQIEGTWRRQWFDSAGSRPGGQSYFCLALFLYYSSRHYWTPWSDCATRSLAPAGRRNCICSEWEWVRGVGPLLAAYRSRTEGGNRGRLTPRCELRI